MFSLFLYKVCSFIIDQMRGGRVVLGLRWYITVGLEPLEEDREGASHSDITY